MDGAMDREKKTAWLALALIGVFFLGFSLSVNLPEVHSNFLVGDQAVYLAMTLSLAHDHDLEYTRQDLIRYYRQFGAGPQGIFLKRGQDGRIFFAKSWVYSLFAAPFVAVFGPNGFLVFHTLLLALLLAMGALYASKANPPGRALLAALTFLFASVAAAYFFWIAPDFFVMVLVFAVLFLWLYKAASQEGEAAAFPVPAGRLERFLRSDASDVVAAFLLSLAVFSKPPNIILMAPLLVSNLARRKILKTLLLGLVFVLTMGVLFGANYLITGDWNYQGGERKSFVETFPLEKEGVTFENTGHTMTAEGYVEKVKLFPLWLVGPNLYWYFFGRYTGLAWYFFPALLFLVLFFGRRRNLASWLLAGAILLEILIYIVLMPDNYGGGGGSLGNRYFLHIYPLFFFLPPLKRQVRELALCWLMAAVFISQILLNPFGAMHAPAMHAKRFPFTCIPVELSQVNEFPTNVNPNAFRVPAGHAPYDGYLYFLDDNFYPKHRTEDGIWTRDNRGAEIILKTYFPVKTIVVHLLNNPRRENDITVRVENQTQRIRLREKQRATLEFAPGKGFIIRSLYHYKLSVQASKPSIPYFEIESSDERRDLGVFFSLELIPSTSR
jgi:hypothetical protein